MCSKEETLFALISDINANEIMRHMNSLDLDEWCDIWQQTAKDLLQSLLSESKKGKDDLIKSTAYVLENNNKEIALALCKVQKAVQDIKTEYEGRLPWKG